LININHFLSEIQEKNIFFLNSLRDDENSYNFNPVKKGITNYGSKLTLGFSCYALKTFYILGYWDKLSLHDKNDWLNYIKHYQANTTSPSSNLFMDSEYAKFGNTFSYESFVKDSFKKVINLTGVKRYQLSSQKFSNSIRAETKQAIATIYQVGDKPTYKYYEFEENDQNLYSFLNSLDWKNPWSAGGQFSALCVFSKINNSNNNIKLLSNFSKNLLHAETGGYYLGSKPDNSLLVNGAMKVITGLDWINVPIHEPEKLIDLCLSIEPNNEGCDLVDIVYVLFKCLQTITYREDDICEYFHSITEKIYRHYFPDTGGFSYFLDKSQTEYYGVRISNGLKTPDLHGNLLLVWALSMINLTINKQNSEWKILKP